jgi:mono/diheme cytochrome c family protein
VKTFNSNWFRFGILGFAAVVLSACANDMSDQPKFEPYEASSIFTDGSSSRPLAPGTVSWSEQVEDIFFLTGRTIEGEQLDAFPYPVDLEVLSRGQERYNIYCSPCHGQDGYGQGIIVQRGFSPPPSFHIDRLREAPAGYYFEVITNGLGLMYPYGYRVKPADRWAITAYIRALQFSQSAPLDEVPEEDRNLLPESDS